MVDATSNSEEPFLRPDFFAGIVLSTERFIIEVLWERGMVSKTLSFGGDGFLGRCDDHIEIEVQLLLRLAIWGI